MILYRLAKWMEERKRLKRLIAEAEGDCAIYREQKAKVERQMLHEAYLWLDPGKPEAVPAAALHMLDERGVRSPVAQAYAEETVRQEDGDLLDWLDSARKSAAWSWELERPLAGEPIRAEDLIPGKQLAGEALQPQHTR
ncbi:hypothetical protein [Paenibacillus ginsengarvi]|uniref:Uncharacterized protein n=1 Tax=Paenibacillus ginsengarvi TaxID=400777 RepID=A0A3B0BGS2_9BACL|nr:hypothetical protein [Paenibacillus ginsengarvi]RKN71890.1 hypothetical protein D7M11_29115 [Paenibacillus ginsengarvi]